MPLFTFMDIISLSNPTVKQVCALKEKKFRDSLGQFFIEGQTLVDDFLRQEKCAFELVQMFATEDCLNKYAHIEGIVSVAHNVFKKMSDVGSDSGVLAVLTKPERGFCVPTEDFLVLDNIQDPGNLGSILRSASACGFKNIYKIGGVDTFSPKVIRASMSGYLHTQVINIDVNMLQNFDSVLLAATVDGQNYFSYEFLKHEIYGLVIGNEANGISQDVKSFCKSSITLPMQNVESLNASVSAAVLMYQIRFFKGGFYVRS